MAAAFEEIIGQEGKPGRVSGTSEGEVAIPRTRLLVKGRGGRIRAIKRAEEEGDRPLYQRYFGLE